MTGVKGTKITAEDEREVVVVGGPSGGGKVSRSGLVGLVLNALIVLPGLVIMGDVFFWDGAVIRSTVELAFRPLNEKMEASVSMPGPNGRSRCDDLWRENPKDRYAYQTWHTCKRVAEKNGTIDQYQAQVAKQQYCSIAANVAKDTCYGPNGIVGQ